MSSDSYTLREVAELLGVSKRTLQRRIREGAFPNRFLAPGRHGLETRIPSEDVQSALDDLRRGRRSGPTVARMETVTPVEEVQESLVPYEPAPAALTTRDLDSLRDTVLAVVREDRQALVDALRAAMAQRDHELSALRGQLSEIHRAVEGLRARVEAGSSEAGSVEKAEPTLDRLLRELDELEALVGPRN